LEAAPRHRLSTEATSFKDWLNLKPKFQAARRYTIEMGWDFTIITDREIRTPYLKNITLLIECRKHPIDEAVTKLLLEALNSLGETNPDTLLRSISQDSLTIATMIPTLWQLVADYRISADLEKPLTMSCRIWSNCEGKGVTAMSRFIILAPGAVVESAGARYVISHILSLERILAKDEATGKIAELRIANLTPSAATNSKVEVKEVALIDQKDWAAAERCLDQIRPLLFVRRTKEMVKSVAVEMGIGLSSLYRKIELYERTGLVSELIPRRSSGGRGHSGLMPEAEAVIASTIDEVYLSKQKRSIKKTADEISTRFRTAKLAPPHYNTVRNRIVAIAEKERDKKRLGARAANDKYGAHPLHFPGADWPLAVVQIDHTKFDIMLVDDVHRVCIGRPWVTVAIDVFSRMVAGIYVSLDPPNTMSVGLCIAHAILPKDQWLAKLGLSTAWPCWA
jgi:hypothetical protein